MFIYLLFFLGVTLLLFYFLPTNFYFIFCLVFLPYFYFIFYPVFLPYFYFIFCPVFLCDVDAGRDIFEVVSNAMMHSKMFIVFGSKTYGFRTASKCSTYQELNFIIDEKRPFFLFKMCDAYEVATTKLTLNRDVAYEEWYFIYPVP